MPNITTNITFRHTDSTPALKAYALNKITHALEKYAVIDAKADIILSVEKRSHIAEVNLHSKRFDVSVKGKALTLYAAIDEVESMLSRQLRRQKDKLTDHHRTNDSIRIAGTSL